VNVRCPTQVDEPSETDSAHTGRFGTWGSDDSTDSASRADALGHFRTTLPDVTRRSLTIPAIFALAAFLPSVAAADGGGHSDPVAPVVLGLAIILVAAKAGAEIAVRLGQAAVLGELLAGVFLGNLDLVGIRGFEALGTDAGLDLIARIGVLVLLFEVGLESTVRDMMRVGVTSFVVACIGVAAPFLLGYFGSGLVLPDESVYAHVFVGATLTATSVGITARVFKDLGRSQTDESRIVLGAAVIDDVLGLVVLAVVTGVIAAASEGRAISMLDVGITIGKASGFLVGSLALGIYLAPRAFRVASRLRGGGVLLALALAFAFVLSWGANAIGLAPIVGAFAAGLILEDVHYRDFTSRGDPGLEVLLHPIASFLVPVFFVVMGVRTDLRAFLEPSVLGLAGVLLVAGVVGKLVSGLGTLGKPVDKLTIGVGMIPRGEVGLIFAGIGKELVLDGHPVVSEAVFSALVVVIIVTTMVTPPLLAMRLRRLPEAPERA